MSKFIRGQAKIAGIVFVLFMFVGISNAFSQGYGRNRSASDLNLQIYLDGQDKISFDSLAYQNTYFVRLKGTTDYQVLWFNINDGEHDLKLEVEDGEFDVYYIFKDGTGVYDFYVLGANSLSATRYKGLCTFEVYSSEEAPEEYLEFELNDLMIEYIDDNMGESIGSGECWDVAQDFLDSYSADWVRTTDFGLPLDPSIDEIKPGDIIQFYSVKLYSETVNESDSGKYYSWSTQTLGSPDHTAVVYEVIGLLHYNLAHQNIGGDRFIKVTEVDLNDRVSGSYWIYRPIAGLIPIEWLE